MGKTDLTFEIEEALRSRAKSKCERYAFEVPIAGGICDFVTAKLVFENHKIPHITCYEIKVSFSDFFYSENGANFVGDDNYYVIPQELWYEIVSKNGQTKIPNGVGMIFYYGDGKLRKQTDSNRHRWADRLSLEDRFVVMDTMIMRILSTGQ